VTIAKLSAAVVGLAVVTIAGFSMGPGWHLAQNPPVVAGHPIEAHLAVPSNVEKILSRSCKDCHSYETRWPWYSRLPLVSGVLADDVKHARSYMNLSDWSATIAKGEGEERAALNGICEELRSDTMPLSRYRRIHRHTHLTGAEVESVCQWTGKAAAASVH
jgi:Haem-binding domain